MVKVEMPLGSETASGRVGKSIIFQGTTAKAYRAPKITKVQAQRDAEARFQAVNRIILTAKTWGRGVFENSYGRGWLAAFYGDVGRFWSQIVDDWDGMSGGDKEAWREAAPRKNLKIDEGLAFFAAAQTLLLHFEEVGGYRFGFPDVFTGDVIIGVGDAEEMWTKDLSGVLLPGKYDDVQGQINYFASGSGWETIEDELAYGGNYRQIVGGQAGWIQIFFKGTAISYIYKEVTVSMGLKMELDQLWIDLFSLNNIEQRYQQQARSRTLTKGLHSVFFLKEDLADPINFDGVIVHG